MALIFTIQESGGDLILSGNGALNISGFTDYGDSGTGVSYIQPQSFPSAGIQIGPDLYWGPAYGGPQINTFRDFGMSGPTSIGSGTTFIYPSIFDPASDGFGYRFDQNLLVLPDGYSGQTLNATATVTGQTLSSAGITPGVYTWTTSNGENIVISAILAPSPTPTPTPTETSAATPTPTPTETSAATPTPTPTETTAARPTPTPTPTESSTTTTTTIPFITSANTEYVECRICEGVANTQDTPHPVYTDNYGNEVIQMNAVLIGGNGLNS